jgi:putative transcriptional regulator
MIAHPFKILVALAAIALTVWTSPAAPADTSGTVLLVAKRNLHDPFYGATVLLVRPVGGEQHVGVILNRPSKVRLGELFPEHKPSQTVKDPVYVGGPMSSQVIFAIVQRQGNPGGKSLQMTPDVFMVFDGATVDQVIEKDAAQARFLAGLVVWQPGELRDEVKRGAWHVLEAEPATVLRKQTDGMWEELVRRAEMRANGI